MNIIKKFDFACLLLFICPYLIACICVDVDSVWNFLHVSDLTCYVSGVRLWDFNMRRNSSVKAGLHASDSDRWYRCLLEVSLLDSKYSRVSTDINIIQPLAIPISLLKILLCWVTASISSSTINCVKYIIGVKVCNILASDFIDFRAFISGLFMPGTNF